MTLTLPRTAGAFAALMALGLAAGTVRAQDTAQAPAAPAEAPAPVSADTVVATVNGKPITLGEMIALRRELPAETQAIPPRVLFQGLLDQLVTFELMAQATEAQNLTERKDFAMVMANTIRIGKANIHMRHEVNTRVTAEALQALYKERYLDNPVEEVRASHILVDSEEKAAELKAQIDGGADFAEVAKEHGTDGTRSRGAISAGSSRPTWCRNSAMRSSRWKRARSRAPCSRPSAGT